MINPDIEQQYIDVLLQLNEKSFDHSWLHFFKALKIGGGFVGGGAGSLNDWGPAYVTVEESAWYVGLYDILDYLFNNKFAPEAVLTFKQIKYRNNFRILRCTNCGQPFQHPRVFEQHIAFDFYARHLPKFVASNKLERILNPIFSYNSVEVNHYREQVKNQYYKNKIVVYDFVNENYNCVRCNTHVSIEHDLYRFRKNIFGLYQLKPIKRNAEYHAFEQ